MSTSNQTNYKIQVVSKDTNSQSNSSYTSSSGNNFSQYNVQVVKPQSSTSNKVIVKPSGPFWMS
jgi:hypothetical protein